MNPTLCDRIGHVANSTALSVTNPSSPSPRNCIGRPLHSMERPRLPYLFWDSHLDCSKIGRALRDGSTIDCRRRNIKILQQTLLSLICCSWSWQYLVKMQRLRVTSSPTMKFNCLCAWEFNFLDQAENKCNSLRLQHQPLKP